MIRRVCKSVLGTSLIEAVVALGIVGIVTSGMYALNGQVMNLVKSNQQSSASSLVLQERVEQLRVATWKNATSASYLKDTLLSSAVRSGSSLGTVSEVIKISSYPDSEAIAPIIVSRTSDSSPIIESQGGNFLNQPLVRVDMTIQFEGLDGRPHQKQSTTIMSKSGVARMNIVSGAGGGAAVPTPTPTATPAPTSVPDDGSGDPSPTPTPTPDSTPTPTPTPTPTESGNNGNGNGNDNGNNGNGRGTVGGSSGRG